MTPAQQVRREARAGGAHIQLGPMFSLAESKETEPLIPSIDETCCPSGVPLNVP